MSRLNEVQKEIEQLFEEIERDAPGSRHHPATGNEVAPAQLVRIHLVVSGDLSRMRLRISLQKDDNQQRR